VITNLIKRLEALPASAATLRDVVFVRKILEDLLDYEQVRTVGLNRSGVMGENLTWVMREWYPGRKVIVWAHQSHISRDGYVQLQGDSNQETARLQRLDLGTLREAAENRLGPVLYSVAFTAHHGQWGTLHSPPTPFVAPPEATETLLHATGWPYLFIDFRRLPRHDWSRDPQIGLKLYAPQPLDWSRHFDGLMFTDEMFPSRPDGHVPRWAKEKLRR
jgi:erythromycin esterase